MPLYRVLNSFKDKHNDKVYEVGKEIKLTLKRAKEVDDTSKEYGLRFIEQVEEVDK